MLLVFSIIWGISTYDLEGLSPGVDISVAGCHMLTSGVSVAILAAGFGVVVAPWYGHHTQHISAPWKDCSTVVGALVTAWWVNLNLLFPTTRDDLLHTTIF